MRVSVSYAGGISLSRIRILFAGATGKTGSAVARFLCSEQDLELVGAVGYRAAGRSLGSLLGIPSLDIVVSNDLETSLKELRPDVLVDFTTPRVGGRNALLALRYGVRPVVGTTGISDEELDKIQAACKETGLGAVICANFSFGALLLMRFAAEAMRFFRSVEVIEKHHQTKLDAPSGTALRIAKTLVQHGADPEPPIHSVRLPGFVAHHEVIFGGNSETLTLRHDTLGRDSFGPGVALSVREVMKRNQFILDLEELISGSAAR